MLCMAGLMVVALRYLVPVYERRRAAASSDAAATGPHDGWHDPNDAALPVVRKPSGTQAPVPTQVLVSEHTAPATQRAANGRANAAAGSGL